MVFYYDLLASFYTLSSNKLYFTYKGTCLFTNQQHRNLNVGKTSLYNVWSIEVNWSIVRVDKQYGNILQVWTTTTGWYKNKLPQSVEQCFVCRIPVFITNWCLYK